MKMAPFSLADQKREHSTSVRTGFGKHQGTIHDLSIALE